MDAGSDKAPGTDEALASDPDWPFFTRSEIDAADRGTKRDKRASANLNAVATT
jgi:hypothetical protein